MVTSTSWTRVVRLGACEMLSRRRRRPSIDESVAMTRQDSQLARIARVSRPSPVAMSRAVRGRGGSTAKAARARRQVSRGGWSFTASKYCGQSRW